MGGKARGAKSALVRFGLALLAGLLAGAGQAPFSLLPLSLAGFVGAFLLLAAPDTPGRAARTGWVFGSAYFAVTLHWIVEPFFVDFARHGWMAPFALVFMAGGLALFWALAFWGARRLARNRAVIVLAWPAALTLAEWLRGWVFTGFPWATIGYLWTDWPTVQLAAWLGGLGLTLLTLLCASVAGWLILFLWPGPRVVASVLPLVAPLVAGIFLAPGQAPDYEGRPVVRMIQPNAPQHQKWDPNHIHTFYNRQLDFTSGQPDGASPALIIWPESAIPWTGDNAARAFSHIVERAGGAKVALGFQRLDAEGRYHNSLAVLSGSEEPVALYDKHHLVPFGEYMPLSSLAQAAGISGLAANNLAGFTPGPGAELLDFGELGRALPLICYELIFPRNIRAVRNRPDFLLHVTNDAWFGQTAGPQQHFAQARFRAVEQGLPVARAANTGISAMIDGKGRVIRSIPLGEAGYLDAALPPALPPTFYARTGDGPTIFVAILLLGLSAGLQRRRV